MAMHSPVDSVNDAGLSKFVRRSRTDRSDLPASKSGRSARSASACIVIRSYSSAAPQRFKVRLAMAAGASSGIAKHELTLISQRT
jgi:hypothetical protein